jgi:hypothetical protein
VQITTVAMAPLESIVLSHLSDLAKSSSLRTTSLIDSSIGVEFSEMKHKPDRHAFGFGCI